ncbi:MAG: hypothetical protein JO359_15245 [Candidatus Eremiobacteraeota bacterium]|nr:hypothetical protein [Candidatus Eremiobacteraeota bacterium]
MRYDDEMLERALQALPLEETPPDLHARILAVTVQRPAPVFHSWELWIVGFALALTSWLVLAITGSPLAGGASTSSAIQRVAERAPELVASALSPSALMWLGIGVIAAVWFSQLTFPGRGEGLEA